MSAVEEVKAAAAKLTKLNLSSDIDALDYDDEDATLYGHIGTDEPVFIFRAHEDGIIPQTGRPDPDTFALAELIATLHATIDAQLAILASALGDAEGSHDEPGAFSAALDLARAINGGTA